MPKYSINTKGEIFENNNKVNEISSKLIGDIKSTKKPSEELDFLISTKYLGLQNGNPAQNLINPKSNAIEEYVVKKIKSNVNKSFDFLKREGNQIIQKKEEDFEGIDTYINYNSIFDLDSFDNFVGRQIFADDVDFYGVPLFLKDPIDAGQEILIKIITLFDMLIASVVPITLISILQMLIQSNQETNSSNAEYQKMELGKYISYSNGIEILDSFFIIIERSLNSFERLMNYPKFKSRISIKNMFNDIGYFILGYTMYLNPGSKINFLKKEEIQNESDDSNSLNSSQILSDILSTLITSDSFSHPYNLLVRKISKSNYFLRQSSENLSRITTSNGEEVGSFSRTISYLGNYFYRFIGERVAVGEKVYRIEKETMNITSLAEDKFHVTRIKDLPGTLNNEKKSLKDIVLDFLPFKRNKARVEKTFDIYKKNTSITSFRHSLDQKQNETNAWQMMSENTTNRLFPTGELGVSRLPKDIVDKIEGAIEKEYMPFSFHDLRTNEVFRFHAFIDSITDGFSPSYSDSSGFGRMDPVKIYTGTTRSIGLSFWLIATSKDDHDEMWYYINRMVAMIYPQWSKPETAQVANYKEILASNGDYLPFGKPFTQIPIASPVIRIRVGDLIKSNYDKDVVLKNVFDLKKGMYENNTDDNNNGVNDKKNSFIKYLNNSPIVQNYEKVKGQGIAGVIRSLNVVTDQNATWEIDEGSRAPISIKIDIQFDPIHDVSLGLNHLGDLRALPYNIQNLKITEP
jgi:hypothetical protein